VKGIYDNDSGTVTLQNALATESLGNLGTSSFSVTTSGANILVNVTGAEENLEWRAFTICKFM